jgi:hypothetical protein
MPCNAGWRSTVLFDHHDVLITAFRRLSILRVMSTDVVAYDIGNMVAFALTRASAVQGLALCSNPFQQLGTRRNARETVGRLLPPTLDRAAEAHSLTDPEPPRNPELQPGVSPRAS